MGTALQLSGHVRLFKNGLLVAEGSNILTELAFEEIAKFLAGEATSLPSHIAVGTGGTFPDPSQTSLDIEVERVTLTKSRIGREVTYIATAGLTFGSPTVVLECGVFDDPTAGTMFARFLTGKVEFLPGDNLDVEWELTIGDIV